MVNNKSQIRKKQYENAILYFLKYCNNQHLGKTKLNKLLYYLDFISFRDRKQAVTGDIYLHTQYGPVPETVDIILKDLQKENFITIEKISLDENKDKWEHKLLKDPDLSVFDGYEKNLLENICKEFNLWSTDKIVEQTHLEAPWFYSKPYEEVDYKYANDIEFFPK